MHYFGCRTNGPGFDPRIVRFFSHLYFAAASPTHALGVPCPPRIVGGGIETLVGCDLSGLYPPRFLQCEYGGIETLVGCDLSGLYPPRFFFCSVNMNIINVLLQVAYDRRT